MRMLVTSTRIYQASKKWTASPAWRLISYSYAIIAAVIFFCFCLHECVVGVLGKNPLAPALTQRQTIVIVVIIIAAAPSHLFDIFQGLVGRIRAWGRAFAMLVRKDHRSDAAEKSR